VIDAQRFLAPENAAGAAVPAEVAAAIAAAASTHGFFQLVNHGCEPALLHRMTAAMHAFFDLDLDAKLAVGDARRRAGHAAHGFASWLPPH
jgi:isopenicillin N synthase-like dioxygenase